MVTKPFARVSSFNRAICNVTPRVLNEPVNIITVLALTANQKSPFTLNSVQYVTKKKTTKNCWKNSKILATLNTD